MDLQARIREKWAAKHGSGLTLTSTDNLSEQDSVTLSSKIRHGLNKETLLHSSLSPADAIHQDRLSSTAGSNTASTQGSLQDSPPTEDALANPRPNVTRQESQTSLKASPEFVGFCAMDHKRLQECKNNFEEEAQLLGRVKEKDLQSRIKEKWATKQRSASTFTSSNDLSTGGTSKSLHSQTSDVLDTSGHDQNLQCRPKVRPGKPEMSLEASPEFVDTFECEVFQEGEELGNIKWRNCAKNPGHHEFIPVNDFTYQHLPKAYRNQTYLEGIKSIAKLTVRLIVKKTSENRPKGYVFANLKGTPLAHKGSGFVYTRLFSDDIKSSEVPDLLTSEGREDKGLEDHFAAKYDGKNAEEKLEYYLGRIFEVNGINKKSLKHVQRVMKPVVNVFGDIQSFSRFLSDVSGEKDPRGKDDAGDLDKTFRDLSVTPSYFGVNPIYTIKEMHLRNKADEFWGDIMAHIDPQSSRKRHENKWEREYRILSRIRKREKAIKKVYWLYKKLKIPGEILSKAIKVSLGVDEVDNDNDVNADFIDTLPYLEEDNDDNYLDTITYEDVEKYDDQVQKETTDSMDVQNSDAGEQGKNDFSDQLLDDKDFKNVNDCDEESLNETFGVVFPCLCPDCEKSKNPEPEGFYVNVLTARHVVFDENEAKSTVVELFCDDESNSGIVTLHAVGVQIYSQDGDLAILMCATHDMTLIQRLRLLVSSMITNIKTMKYESDTPLAVMCSHPHGNFKHVTIGEWIKRDIYRRRDERPPLWTSYLYNTPSCSGSSGAPVVILGHKEGTLLLDSMLHPHHGSHNRDLNKSSRLISFENKLEDVCPKIRKRAWEEQREIRRKIRQEKSEKGKDESEMFATMHRSLTKLPLEKMAQKLHEKGVIDLQKYEKKIESFFDKTEEKMESLGCIIDSLFDTIR